MSFLSLELKIELTSLPSTGQRPHFKKRDLLSGVNNQLFVRVLILMTFAYTAVVFVVAFRSRFWQVHRHRSKQVERSPFSRP